MSIFTIAFPERLAKYGALDFVKERLGVAPDLRCKNKCQRIGDYEFVIMYTRMVPYAVDNGILTGICGDDWLTEYTLGKLNDLVLVERLNFGEASVVAFKDKRKELSREPRTVTPYPNIARRYLQEKNYGDDIELYVPGETEGSVKAGLFDLGIDNMSSGRTIGDTGLEEIDNILDSSAIIISKEANIDKVRRIWGLE